jgi:multidrug resistance efflux pump
LQLAQSEFRRVEELYRDKVVSEKIYEEARVTKERLEAEVQERARLIEEQEKNLGAPQLRAAVSMASTNLGSAQSVMQASINVQEEKLRLTEAELSPIELHATIDGMVSSILRRSGEAVIAGEPILTISTGSSDRIIAYLRQPLLTEPKIGMAVQVYARSFQRQAAEATILRVGTQMEPIKEHLLPFMNGHAPEMGLPILVGLPPSLKLVPGEIVDLRLIPQSEHD